MRGQQHTVVRIGRGIGQHGLFGRAYTVERFADGLHVDLPAPEEAVEIEDHRGDAFVAGGLVERMHEVTCLVFAHRRFAGQQRLDGVDLCTLLDHDAIEFEHQRTVTYRGWAGAGGQHGEQRREEQQHENEHQPVLDAHQEAPDLSSELHANNLLLAPR